MTEKILFKNLVNQKTSEVFKKILENQKNVRSSLYLIRYAKKLDEEIVVFKNKIKDMEQKIKDKDEEALKQLQLILEEETLCEQLPFQHIDGIDLTKEEIATIYPFVKDFE